MTAPRGGTLCGGEGGARAACAQRSGAAALTRGLCASCACVCARARVCVCLSQVLVMVSFLGMMMSVEGEGE